MKITFRKLKNNIENKLIDSGWSATWARNFVDKEDSKILLKISFKCLSSIYSKRHEIYLSSNDLYHHLLAIDSRSQIGDEWPQLQDQ